MRYVVSALLMLSPFSDVRGASAEPSRGGAEVNPSALLFHKPHHDGGPEQIRRIVELGFRKVNVVVTLWCEINEDRQVTSYGALRDGRFHKLDDSVLAEFRKHLDATFAAALDAGLDVTVTAHLNAGGKVDDWRNYFLFDPEAAYAGYSYRTAMIESVADALAAVTFRSQAVESSDGPKVDFAMVGEMGRTLFAYPDAYRQMIEPIRRRALPCRLRLGVSLNFEGARGEFRVDESESPPFESLWQSCDFLGMSLYRGFEPPPTADHFAVAVERFLAQLDMPGVRAHRRLPIHFSEVAIGGGVRNDVPAATPAEAARQPWVGCTTINPWEDAAMRRFRIAFHQALIDYLDGPAATTVTGAFLWSEASWDPLDTIDSGFADEQIAEMLRRHNRRVRQRSATGAELSAPVRSP